MRRRLFIIAAVILLLPGAWLGVGVYQVVALSQELRSELRSNPGQFMYNPATLTRFADTSDLQIGQSIGPMLKDPWRDDVRLYFTFGGGPAYATHDRATGSWFVKWP